MAEHLAVGNTITAEAHAASLDAYIASGTERAAALGKDQEIDGGLIGR